MRAARSSARCRNLRRSSGRGSGRNSRDRWRGRRSSRRSTRRSGGSHTPVRRRWNSCKDSRCTRLSGKPWGSSRRQRRRHSCR
jgi:hypothetical protein